MLTWKEEGCRGVGQLGQVRLERKGLLTQQPPPPWVWVVSQARGSLVDCWRGHGGGREGMAGALVRRNGLQKDLGGRILGSELWGVMAGNGECSVDG